MGLNSCKNILLCGIETYRIPNHSENTSHLPSETLSDMFSLEDVVACFTHQLNLLIKNFHQHDTHFTLQLFFEQ